MSGRSASSVGAGGIARAPDRSSAVYRRLADDQRAAIQAEALDLGRDRRRYEVVDRQPRRDPVADLRGGDGERRDREQLDAVGPRQRGDDALEIAQVGARPRRSADARELEHALGAHPGRERGELVGADQEDGIVEAERLERVDRPGERVERDLGLVDRREGELGQREA